MCVKLDREKCIGCGSCVSLTDQKIFDFDDEGKAYVVSEKIADEDMDTVRNVIDYCPTSAIYFESEK